MSQPSKKIIFSILGLGIFLFIGFIFINIILKSKPPSTNQANDNLVKFPDQDLEKTKKYFIELALKENPRVALLELAENMQTDELLSRSCHGIIHEIGHESYNKYKDFAKAMSYSIDICISGYTHGVIEAYFENISDIFSAMKEVCKPYPEEKNPAWNCYHGVGHGLMYWTGNNLPRALELCDVYDSKFAKDNCANGVFMENFGADDVLHPSRFVSKENPASSCVQEKTHKQECYLYAGKYYLTLIKEDYSKAFNWCKNIDKNFIDSCIAGLGGEAIKNNLYIPLKAESICDKAGSLKDISTCIDGLIGLYIHHTASISDSHKLCNYFTELNKSTCENGIKSREYLFK
ncbi:MAG: hypothetical protein EXS49_00815 [Candidatus Pacebacteria bacterium]|nr:hypothetical protein [Candidatus Paceibacterota bacterium]